MKEQTAIEWLVEQFELTSNSPIIKNVIEQAKEMEKEQSHMYAEFAIKCEYMTGKVLNFDEFMKFETFKNTER
jgi:hypothetical protein